MKVYILILGVLLWGFASGWYAHEARFGPRRRVERERDALRAALARANEEIRLREESQIPVIPRGAQEKLERLEATCGHYETLIGEADDAIAHFRVVLENLAGDVYLYGLDEISFEQLMATQGEALRLLGPTPA